MLMEALILALALPSGYLIAWLARDELLAGQAWFWLILLSSLILTGIFYTFSLKYLWLSCLFIAVVSAISIVKSYDTRWTERCYTNNVPLLKKNFAVVGEVARGYSEY